MGTIAGYLCTTCRKPLNLSYGTMVYCAEYYCLKCWKIKVNDKPRKIKSRIKNIKRKTKMTKTPKARKSFFSILRSTELDRRIDFLKDKLGENRSVIVRRCIDHLYEKTLRNENSDSFEFSEPVKKIGKVEK